jgi:hypothetical protein
MRSRSDAIEGMRHERAGVQACGLAEAGQLAERGVGAVGARAREQADDAAPRACPQVEEPLQRIGRVGH